MAYVVVYGSPTTVDGLFVSLMLLAMSGIFVLNVMLELRRRRSGAGAGAAAQPRRVAAGVDADLVLLDVPLRDALHEPSAGHVEITFRAGQPHSRLE